MLNHSKSDLSKPARRRVDSPEERITELIGDEDEDGFWETVEKNLRSKNIRLVFVADTIPSELKRVVEFLNEAMQEVEVVAIEVIQYASGDDTVFVPRLHGQTEEAKAASSSTTSRTGSEYVETEADLYTDLEQKVEAETISEEVYQAFINLYDFSKDLGDAIDIGGAKNANFGLQITAHQGDYSGTPSVFTANVTGKLKIWTAGMPLNGDDPSSSPVPWDPSVYNDFQTAFETLDGVPSDKREASFDLLAHGENLEDFETMVSEFVTRCRQAATE